MTSFRDVGMLASASARSASARASALAVVASFVAIANANECDVVERAEFHAERAKRFAIATMHFAPTYGDYIRHRWRSARAGNGEDVTRASRQILWRDVATRFSALAKAQGGIYVKAGQHVAAQPVAPAPLRDGLKGLMDDAGARPFDEDERTFREDFGVSIDDAFAEFDRTPVASASLAQVYRATTLAGERVAVKIQQRPVARFLKGDLATIELYYSLLSALIPGLRFQWLADETRRHMAEELDFTAEAANAAKASRLLANDFTEAELKIPRVHRHLSSKRVLTMEWCDGVRIDDVESLRRNRVDTADVAARVQKMFGKMTFVYGFVHVDPHPGNILVDSSGRIILLDHGVYRTLDDDLRVKWANVWLSLIRSDDAALRDATASLGINPDMSQFFKLILALMPTQVIEDPLVKPGQEPQSTHTSSMDSLSPAGKRMVLRQILGVKLEDQSQLFENLPRDLLLVLKANNLLRFINEQLGSPVNRFKYIAAAAHEGLAKTTSTSPNPDNVRTIKRGVFSRMREQLGDSVAITVLPLQLMLLKGQLAWAFWKVGKKQAASVASAASAFHAPAVPATPAAQAKPPVV